MKRVVRSMGVAVLAAGLVLFAAGQASAGAKFVVDGISVKYSGNDIDVYRDVDTLVIEIFGPPDYWGKLKVSALPSAAALWPNLGGTAYCDLFIDASGSPFTNVTVKGRPDLVFFVGGEVGYAIKFALSLGFVGGLDTWAWGLGSVLSDSGYYPNAISIKYGAAIWDVLSWCYTCVAPAGTKLRDLPKDKAPTRRVNKQDLLRKFRPQVSETP
jgi:hypothetical protein